MSKKKRFFIPPENVKKTMIILMVSEDIELN